MTFPVPPSPAEPRQPFAEGVGAPPSLPASVSTVAPVPPATGVPAVVDPSTSSVVDMVVRSSTPLVTAHPVARVPGPDEPTPVTRGGPFVPGSLPSASAMGLPQSTQEVLEFVRDAAAARGIDPDVAARVVASEGGFTPAAWIGDGGSSFGPAQLHYAGMAPGANAVGGLGDRFTADTGLDARNLSTWRQQIAWSLDYVSQTHSWDAWHGAARVGIASNQGLSGAHTAGVGGYQQVANRFVSIPNQFDAGLSSQDAYAACGPVAAVALARWLGRSPTVPEVLEIAKRVGWTRDGGMNGIANEKRLLDAMGIPAFLETRVDWNHVRADAMNGHPVILSTPGHYWVIDDYNPIARTYHVGQSGLAYANGKEWMTGNEILQLGGQASGALYVANPLIDRPSVAAQHPAPAVGAVMATTTGDAFASQTPARDEWWRDLPANIDLPARESV